MIACIAIIRSNWSSASCRATVLPPGSSCPASRARRFSRWRSTQRSTPTLCTSGNPFFATETLAGRGEVIPSTVRDAVHARVARLSPAARDLLDAVAVVPQRAEIWLLKAMSEGGLGALDECLRSGVLRAGPRSAGPSR